MIRYDEYYEYYEDRLYILMRNDLPSMVPGRCMAQASHAASKIAELNGNHSSYKTWKGQAGKQGFGTCIVLSASMEQINDIMHNSRFKEWVCAGLVVDPDYRIKISSEVIPFLDPTRKDFVRTESTEDGNYAVFSKKETTCAYILCKKEEAVGVLDHLELY